MKYPYLGKRHDEAVCLRRPGNGSSKTAAIGFCFRLSPIFIPGTGLTPGRMWLCLGHQQKPQQHIDINDDD